MSVEWELKFQPSKIIWLRLHSPGWNQLFLEMNNVSTNAIAFVLFVYFWAN